jgi:type I restriction enzyme S subunit
MTWGTFREEENKAVPTGVDFNPNYEIKPGDILVSRANTEEYVGAPVMVERCRRHLLLSDKSLRLVPSGYLNSRWLYYMLSSPIVREEISRRATGTKDSMRNVSQETLASIRIQVPPLAEQDRIVAALEDHLSKLDAATSGIRICLRRLKQLKNRIILEAVPIPCPDHWNLVTVADAGVVDLGRQRHPDWHSGPNMRPYLRVANVFEDRIDLTSLMEMDFPPREYNKFRLVKGDILLNEGQSPEFLGRPAMYRGQPPEVAFTNTLLRFRARPDVLPEWALLVFRRHMHAGRFIREVRITTNIAHLSAGRFKAVEFPVPPAADQERIAAGVNSQLASVDWLGQNLESSMTRAVALRRSLLADAFTGRLVRQDPAVEPVSVLLERIRAERAVQPKARKGRGAGKYAPQEEKLL